MQQEWQLSDEDIAPIESRMAAEIEVYRHKLRQYEQALTEASQRRYSLSVAQRNALLEEQHSLGLTDEDITPLEARMNAAIETYQQKLQQYGQVLTEALQHEYPLGEEICKELRRFQEVLELDDEEVAEIEAKVVRQIGPTEIQPAFSTPTAISDNFSEPQPACYTFRALAKNGACWLVEGLLLWWL
jgi:hypothetical protein